MVRAALAVATPDRLLVIAQAFRYGLTVEEVRARLSLRPLVPGPDRRGSSRWRPRCGGAACPRIAPASCASRSSASPMRAWPSSQVSRKTKSPSDAGGSRCIPSTSASTPVRPSSPPRPPTCTRPTRATASPPPSARRSRARHARSSSSAADPTASARASSSTIAACTRSMRCARPATRRSWSTATPRPCRPTTTPPTAFISSRSPPRT